MTMAPRLLIATTNEGKLREFRSLTPENIVLVSLTDLVLPSPDETGNTLAENALLKAQSAATSSGLLCLADDSGLEVDALGGDPGVYSARYAGEPASDRRNIEKLLVELDGVPASQRTARFRCVVSIAAPDGPIAQAEGVCEGKIGFEPRGDNGFGYDPIFLLPCGQTMAELSPSEKNVISHRSMAIAAIAPTLRSLLENQRTSLS
jgi:XTP/dITP diphosphohydrolase